MTDEHLTDPAEQLPDDVPRCAICTDPIEETPTGWVHADAGHDHAAQHRGAE